MALRRISNLSLADQVFEQLTSEIMRGTYETDSYLPPERTLSLTFEVNRHVVREALKRLEQMGLVQVAQGGGTRVLDFRRTAGLDLLGLLAKHAGEHAEHGGLEDVKVLSFWFSVLEVRMAQIREIVRLCTARASAEVKQTLVDVTARMQAAHSDEALYALELAFWDHAIIGADNVVYRLSYNSMLNAVEAMGEQAKAWSVREIKAAKYRVPLAAAIAAGNAQAADASVRSALQTGLDALGALLKQTSIATPAPAPSREARPKRAAAATGTAGAAAIQKRPRAAERSRSGAREA